MPYSQAPTPCHPALWRAPAVPMQCNTSMLPAPAPVCSKGVRSPAEPASAPRLLAADRRYGHLGPESAWIVANRPSSMPGRVWSSLVFAGLVGIPPKAQKIRWVSPIRVGCEGSTHTASGEWLAWRRRGAQEGAAPPLHLAPHSLVTCITLLKFLFGKQAANCVIPTSGHT